jgi:chromosome condensin MukBEF complex kleisin-like MukF subunit
VRCGKDRLNWNWVGTMAMKLELWEVSLVVEKIKMRMEEIKELKEEIIKRTEEIEGEVVVEIDQEELKMIMDESIDHVLNYTMTHYKYKNKLLIMGINLRQL